MGLGTSSGRAAAAMALVQALMAFLTLRAAHAMPGVAASFLGSAPPPPWSGWTACAAFALATVLAWRHRRYAGGRLPVESALDACSLGFGLTLVVVGTLSVARAVLGH